ncbi:MAG TPA: arsenite efflux transporter metallochaperone ArsD [Planococcus sp. (in: firmicutes)]|nr:arsenite efflux transporter metallochaperone ArsD [Planococcus sp. (in: firmicutes)]
MKQVAIYDPAMCCDTGVCGPVADPKLTELAAAIHSLEKKGFSVKRFNLANNPAAFVENQTVNAVLFEKGAEALPITLVDGELHKVSEHPTPRELAQLFGVEADELTPIKPKIPLDIKAVSKGAK